MKIRLLITILSISIYLTSCGEKVQELKEAAELASKAPEMAQNLEKGAAESKKKFEERKQKGDTLAMHFSKLIEFLPKNIDGFTAGKPDGQTTNMAGFSLSNATIDFTNTKNENIKITIADYNQGYDAWGALSMWAQSDINIETSEGYQKTYKTNINGVYGLETYNKSNKRAEMFFAISYRFYVTLEGNDMVGTDLLKKIANSINMNELAKY